MSLDTLFHALSLTFQVFLLDLILSGDNAVVIALACRSLPQEQMKQALLLGTAGAIVLRVLLTTMVGFLLSMPLLKLIGAMLLIVIAIHLLIEEDDAPHVGELQAPTNLGSAMFTIIGADLVMSLDNVVALAAAALGNPFYLLVGLLLSVPLLMFGSRLLTGMLHRYPQLIPAAGALLGYIAGDIAVTDPAIVDWVNTQSPALHLLVPLLCAVFVVLQSRIIQRRRTELPRPLLRTALRVHSADLNAGIDRAASEEAMTDAHSLPASGARWTQALAQAQAPAPAALTASEGSGASARTATPAPMTPATRMTPLAILAVSTPALGLVAIFIAFALGASDSSQVMTSRDPASPGGNSEVTYVCPGSNTSLVLRHGSGQVRLVGSNGELNGRVDHANMIHWGSPPSTLARMHFAPPDRLEEYANAVRLSGGSYADMRCPRQSP